MMENEPEPRSEWVEKLKLIETLNETLLTDIFLNFQKNLWRQSIKFDARSLHPSPSETKRLIQGLFMVLTILHFFAFAGILLLLWNSF